MTLRYPAEVFWSEEDGGWIAIAPDLPGCSAFGECRPDALKELEPAIEAWIEAAKAAGNSIPYPRRGLELRGETHHASHHHSLGGPTSRASHSAPDITRRYCRTSR